jgi:hypothetical protein
MRKLPRNLRSSEMSKGVAPSLPSNNSAQPINSQSPLRPESDIETLARETDMPLAIVRKIYQIEHAKLDRVAKIKTYVPVLIRRRVKERLQAQRSALQGDALNRSLARIMPIL